MSLEFTKMSPERAFNRLLNDLKTIDRDFNVSGFIGMTPKRLNEEINRIDEALKTYAKESLYGSWLSNEKFVKQKILREALEILHGIKSEKMESEQLIPGFTYYRGVKQFGNKLTGQRCYYLGEDESNWVPFKENVSVLKALEVIRHGAEDDFKTIYFEMADGLVDPFGKITIEHITESSKTALNHIEEYCDNRWIGVWPWEVSSPYKLRNIIQEKREHRMRTILEMQNRFNKIIDQLREDEMEQYDVVNMTRDMTKQVDNMIGDLGKISSKGIEATAGVRSLIGDSAAESLQSALDEPVQNSAQALSRLKAALHKAMNSIQNNKEQCADSDPTDDLGGDAGLGDPVGDDLSDELADVNLDGADGERPTKEL